VDLPRYPRISFGIIVVNGEPFTHYCLRSIYSFAYEIIVVEGGHEGARAVTTPDGHSLDSTLETLVKFKQEEDPENKVQIITKQGHWQQKDELGRDRTPQSRAYAERVTGDYLWQIDIDEFYLPQDMQEVIEMLSKNPSVSMVSFESRNFWARPEYLTDCWELHRGLSECHRIFKWGSNYKYLTHEPPTVIDDHEIDLHSLNWIRSDYFAKKGIYMYHYPLLFPWQVKQKTILYQNEKPDYCKEIVNWAENNYFHLRDPFHVHNLYRSPSWLDRYNGAHPPVIVQMMDDIQTGKLKIELRAVEDVEALLSTPWYTFGRGILKIIEPINRVWTLPVQRVRHMLRTIFNIMMRWVGIG
jgi:hypothetical protein